MISVTAPISAAKAVDSILTHDEVIECRNATVIRNKISGEIAWVDNNSFISATVVMEDENEEQ